jgi:hypothetical protein
MIKVQALKESPQQSQASRQDYVFEEKSRGSFGPLAFLTVLAGFAVYLKSFFSAAKEAPPDQQKSRTQNTENDGTAARGSEEEGLVAEPPLPDAPENDAAGSSDNVVPMTARRTVTQDMVDSFLASDSPPFIFNQSKSGPAARLDLGLSANDNQSALKPLSSGEKEEIKKIGVGGGSNGEAEELGVLPRRVNESVESRVNEPVEIGDAVPYLGRPLPSVDGRPRDDGGPADRNRLPRTNGPVILPDLIGCQAYFIPVLALLAGASDADGDQLKVTALSATSGTLVPVEGGWMFTPDRNDLRDLVFKYAISDGTGAVQQLAHLRIVDAPPIVGTDGDDNLLGTACGDVIDARDGHDNIDARLGDDFIMAGTGDDHIVAGDGNDAVFAGAGNDIVFAGTGNDIVYGGDGNDRLFGEEGDDTVFGEQGNDFISGGTGNDVLLAGAGDDIVHGDAGNDMLDGGAGNDSLQGGNGDDRIAGEQGNDFISGGTGDDVLLAGIGDDIVHGDAGHDMLDGGAGNDSLQGGDGDDHVTAAADATSDWYDGNSGEDTLDYSSAVLDIFVDLGAGTAESLEIGRDFIAGFEKIIGGQGDDHLVGGPGPISMAGGDGDDTFEFKRLDDDHQPDLVRKITDFTYGDRIIAARYEIFYRREEGVEEEITDLFQDIYLSENSDHRPIRFRFEKLENGDLTFVDVHRENSDEFFSIELSGRHDLEFTVVVS